MTARRRKGATPRQATTMPAAAAAVRDVVDVTGREAAKVAEVVVAAAPATQVRRPWRSTLRTTVQIVLGFAPLLPSIVSASGVDGSLPAVGAALALSAGITRVMGLPGVEAFLQRFVPWLAASPRPPAA